MMLDAFTALRAAFTKRFDSLEARVPDMLHGIVEAVNPVAVRLLDGSLVSGLDTLDPTVKVTDRVRLIAYGGFLTGRRLLVLGKVGGAAWPKPRRMGLTGLVSVPHAPDYRTGGWAGIANDPGDVTGGITYADGGFTVPQDGVYTISTVIRWLDGAFTQDAELKLFTGPSLNNTTQNECMLFRSHQDMHCAWTVYLEAGYRAEVRLRQISGTTQYIGGNPAYNWCQIARTG